MGASLRIYPHRTAPPEYLSSEWWLEQNGARSPLPIVLHDWDYQSELTLGLSASFDAAAIVGATGIRDVGAMSVAAIADCAATGQRLVATVSCASAGSGSRVDVRVPIPPGTVAGKLVLSVNLILMKEGGPSEWGRAQAKGSRLSVSDNAPLVLEGEAARFPTEPVAFSERGLGTAPWTLIISYESMADSFMGSVRLLVNTEHPAGQALLNPDEAQRFVPLLRADVIRMLVSTFDVAEWDDADDYGEESIAEVLEGMCLNEIGCSFVEARVQSLADPIAFDRLLHARLTPLRGFVS